MAWADPLAPAYPDIEVIEVEPLAIDHPSVVVAAETSTRRIG